MGTFGQAPSPANQAFELQINTLGRLVDVKQFEDIVIRAGGGSTAAVHLRDLGRVELGALSYNSNGYLGDKPTVILAIYQLPGANALDLDKQVRAKMAELSPRFPPGISYVIKYDTTMFVAASLREVVITLAEAMGLVFIVVFVFLQGWRTTLIPAISIPVSLIGTLGVMEVAGFSINTVSLLGLVLAYFENALTCRNSLAPKYHTSARRYFDSLTRLKIPTDMTPAINMHKFTE
jgi:multidrug efflux pump subunit AcrB